MKCTIHNQVVLSRAPEGPLAARIGSFAESVSKQGTVRHRCIDRFCSLHVLADGFSRTGFDCAASAPIMRHGIYDIALDACDLAGGMPLPSSISSAFCAMRA
jgi:hypothetical protein